MPITPPQRIAQPADWQELIDLDEASKVTGLTGPALEAALDDRDVYIAAQLVTAGSRRKAARWHIPNPAGRDPLQWRRGDLTLWALRLGIYPDLFHGVEVIGYTGLADLYDVEEQSVRAMVSNPDEYAPDPVFEVDSGDPLFPIVLYDKAAMRTWGVKTMRLAADGETPTRLRPRR
jgi:hypothetical protein